MSDSTEKKDLQYPSEKAKEVTREFIEELKEGKYDGDDEIVEEGEPLTEEIVQERVAGYRSAINAPLYCHTTEGTPLPETEDAQGKMISFATGEVVDEPVDDPDDELLDTADIISDLFGDPRMTDEEKAAYRAELKSRKEKLMKLEQENAEWQKFRRVRLLEAEKKAREDWERSRKDK